ITRDEVVPERGELYDLADDPGELVNRWADPGVRAVRSHLLALRGAGLRTATEETPRLQPALERDLVDAGNPADLVLVAPALPGFVFHSGPPGMSASTSEVPTLSVTTNRTPATD